MEYTDKKVIQGMIDASISQYAAFRNKKVGDTPTDANQLVPKKYVDSKSSAFAGRVNADGTNDFLPTGWTSSVGGMGGFHYTITHNLGTTNYAIAGTTISGQGVLFATYSANSVDIVLSDLGGSPQNWKFAFILAL